MADSMDPDHIDPTGNGAGYWSATVSGRAPNYGGTGGTGKGATDATVSPSIDPPPTPIVAPFSGLGATPATAFKVNRFILTPNNTALRFTMNEASTASAADFFREPTLLISSNVAGATLRADGTKNVMVTGNPRASTTPTNAQSADISTIPGCLNSQGILCASDTLRYLGVYLGSAPTSWYYDFTGIGGKKGVIAGTKLKATWYNLMGQHFLNSSFSNSSYYLTYRLQYNVGGVWKTYDEKYINSYNNNSSLFAINFASATGKQTVATGGMVGLYGSTAFDPRTGRFNLPLTPGSNAFPQRPNPPSAAGWLNTASSPSPAYILPTNRPDNTSGYSQALRLNGGGAAGGATLAGGWIAGPNDSNNKPTLATGLFSQNTSAGAQHYTDPDGIIRRAMGAYVSSGVTGLPMATAYSTGLGGSSLQLQSRPIVLNRPFKNVGELGYVFSGTPWKNIDFFTSESGDAPLLDIFCINDSSDSNALTAGKVNLNTRQIPVLQAIIAGAYKDEQNSYSTPPAWKLADLTVGTNSEASKAATALVARTTNAASGQGPLMNVANLVGRFVQGYSNPVSSQPFGGFSDDLTSVFTANTASSNIQRFREAPIRALASVGQTRVWNLMIDVVAQTGRYPSSASSAATPLAAFLVEGEQRYWVHIAIDRYTGQIIDKQVEVVKE